jgi:hypothetical protein
MSEWMVWVQDDLPRLFDVQAFYDQHWRLVVFLLFTGMLAKHIENEISDMIYDSYQGILLMIAGVGLGLFVYVWIVFIEPPGEAAVVALPLSYAYGVTLYMVLVYVLREKKFAEWLTRKRGEQWVKEIDYLFLPLGAAGVVATAEKLESGSGPSRLDMLGPLMLTTALVLRLIKTRAEIGEWNKPE